MRYRPEIDGLRAIAVLSVVAFHAGAWPLAGYAGVDVFFVISGYLITSLLYVEWVTTRRIDFFNFYAKRVRRLLPSLVLVVVVTMLASLWLLSPYGEQRELYNSASASLLFVANFFFEKHTGGYFDVSADSLPLLHLWSLGVEEQFYLLWPLTLLIFLRWVPRLALRLLLITALISFVATEWLIATAPSASFFQMPARFWELAVGAVVALSPKWNLKSQTWPVVVAGLVLGLGLLVPDTHFPGWGAIPTVAGTAVLIAAVHGESSAAGLKFLRWRPLVSVGLISYPLYLWHWPLLALARATHAGAVEPWVRVLLCVASALLAWLTYQFVEHPIRRAGLGESSRQYLAAGMISCIAMAVLASTLAATLDQHAPPDDAASRAARDFPANRAECHARGDEPAEKLPGRSCASSFYKPIKVAIWGDSHALAWQPLAWALAGRSGVAAIGYTRDACPPNLDYDNGKHFLESERCRQFNAMVLPEIKGLNLVIMTAAWPTNFDLNGFDKKFEKTIDIVAPTVGSVIILGPTPYLPADVSVCLRVGHVENCSVPKVQFEHDYLSVIAGLRRVAARHSNVTYVDLGDFFCNASTCPGFKAGYPLYWDSNHVSSTAAKKFADAYIKQKNGRQP